MSSFRCLTLAATYAVTLLACSAENVQVPDALRTKLHADRRLASRAPTEWSEPVNVGPPISSSFLEQTPELSHDGRSLYFSSARPGGSGGNDIWVSHRSCADCPWQDPINLGATVNSAGGDAGPSLSTDERIMFFTSNRPGLGLNDIYVTRRANPEDDFGWEAPVLVEAGVSTGAYEHAPLFIDAGAEHGTLYITRGVSNGVSMDLYEVAVTHDGSIVGPVVPVSEFNTVEANEAMITVSRNGDEAIFASDRPLPHVRVTFWVSTRSNQNDPWSEPVSLSDVTPLGTPNGGLHPRLSLNGKVLFFTSARPGSLGAASDIWMSTRSKPD